MALFKETLSASLNILRVIIDFGYHLLNVLIPHSDFFGLWFSIPPR